MAINPTAIWRIRPNGNSANGGGYDSAISGAGADYSQQDSPVIGPLTDIACSNITTITSATGGFTSAMIGNAIRITGGGATTGWYFIIGYTDTNTITLDRTPGTVTNGTGRVGGALSDWTVLLDTTGITGNKAVSGNVVYIRGSGSDTPSSDDYTKTGYTQLVSNSSMTDGLIKIIGENGRPRISSNGQLFYNFAGYLLQNLYVSATSNTNGNLGIIGSCVDTVIDNCVIDTNGKTGLTGISASSNTAIRDCAIFGGSSQPSFSASAFGIVFSSYGGSIWGSTIRHMADVCLYNSGTIYPIVTNNCLIYGGGSYGIYINGGAAITHCTINGNKDGGIYLHSTRALTYSNISRNIISNHTTSSTYGISGAGTGYTLAKNERMRAFVDRNAFYNNYGNYDSTLNAGANDVTGTDPQYADAANGNFAIGASALKGAAYTYRNSGPTGSISYRDYGAMQHQETGSITYNLKKLQRIGSRSING